MILAFIISIILPKSICDNIASLDIDDFTVCTN